MKLRLTASTPSPSTVIGMVCAAGSPSSQAAGFSCDGDGGYQDCQEGVQAYTAHSIAMAKRSRAERCYFASCFAFFFSSRAFLRSSASLARASALVTASSIRA